MPGVDFHSVPKDDWENVLEHLLHPQMTDRSVIKTFLGTVIYDVSKHKS